MQEELQRVQEALETSKQDAAAAAAQLVSLRQLHEEHIHANVNAQDDLMQQVEVLQQTVLLTEANYNAVSAELSMVRNQLVAEDGQGAVQSQKEAEEEVNRLHTDLEHAEEREDRLLLQVQTLEQTVQELLAVQPEAPSEVCLLRSGMKAHMQRSADCFRWTGAHVCVPRRMLHLLIQISRRSCCL